jgi:hypothetical protein
MGGMSRTSNVLARARAQQEESAAHCATQNPENRSIHVWTFARLTFSGCGWKRGANRDGFQKEALYFVWSLPVSTLISGAESLQQLHEKTGLARSFKTLSPEERQRIVQRVSDLAGNAVEYCKA